MLDAACKVAIGLTGLYLMHRRPKLIWPRILVSTQLAAAFAVVLHVAVRNMGFGLPTAPYAFILNVLYGIALFSVLSLGLHDGALSLRAWLSLHHHGRPWTGAGVKWGREAVHPSIRKAKAR
jgi:hypothetical protein